MIRRLGHRWPLLPSALVASISLSASVRYVFQSKEFLAACRELPKTPSGKNPYDVLEVTVTKTMTTEELSKQFREMVIRHHPDKPGGSTEKMTELNAAYAIIKEHHSKVMRAMGEAEAEMKASEAYRQHRHARVDRDEELGRSGGVQRRNVRAMRQEGSGTTRSLKEIEQQWATLRDDAESAVKSMCNRYELAIEQAVFFRKSSMVNEITVRERWLRKSYIKGIWEDVHELRGELLRRRASSAQQSQLAEEMVSFAGVIQRRLNEDFQRLTQKSIQAQSRLYVQRGITIVILLICFVKFWKWFFTFAFRNTLTARFKKAVLGY